MTADAAAAGTEIAAGKSAFNSGDDQASIAHFRRALEAGGSQPVCRLHLARIYNRTRDWQSALEQWLWLRDQDPEELEPQLQVARCYFRSGAHAQAATGFETVLRLAPDHQEALQELPKALVRAGKAAFDSTDYAGAEPILRKALEAGADETECRLYLARIYNLLRDWDRALPQWQWLRDRDAARLEPHLQIARAFLRLGQDADATAAFELVLRLAPDHPEARQSLEELTDRLPHERPEPERNAPIERMMPPPGPQPESTPDRAERTASLIASLPAAYRPVSPDEAPIVGLREAEFLANCTLGSIAAADGARDGIVRTLAELRTRTQQLREILERLADTASRI